MFILYLFAYLSECVFVYLHVCLCLSFFVYLREYAFAYLFVIVCLFVMCPVSLTVLSSHSSRQHSLDEDAKLLSTLLSVATNDLHP